MEQNFNNKQKDQDQQESESNSYNLDKAGNPQESTRPDEERTAKDKEQDQQNINKLLEELRKLTHDDELVESAKFLLENPNPRKVSGLLKNINEYIHGLQKKLSSSKPTGIIINPKVKVFSVVATKTFRAVEEILQQINVVKCDDPKTCDVVFVFCPICTRAAADVAEAMKKIPDAGTEKPVILVTMHHTRKKEYPVSATDWTNEKNVVLHVNVLYHESVNGLLKCFSNDQAIKEIQETTKKIMLPSVHSPPLSKSPWTLFSFFKT